MKKTIVVLLGLSILSPLNVLAYSDYIIPGGRNIGIEVNSEGVIVVGFYKISGKQNKNTLEVGDIITKVEDVHVNSIEELVKTIDQKQQNGSVTLTVIHNNKTREVEFKLIYENDVYKTGLYVKDSISGIGTLTYIDPETKIYGALGHEITESTTHKTIEVKDGSIFKSKVSSIDRSLDGYPGTKNAKFYSNVIYGDIEKNTNHGIYGTYKETWNDSPVEVGDPKQLKLGKATIRTVLSGEDIQEYEIEITRIDTSSDIKNIYFKITDKKLLSKTGGIVQGMSGSPILQDNKIYGAVTHVVINDVEKGYGIFITTMLREGEK